MVDLNYGVEQSQKLTTQRVQADDGAPRSICEEKAMEKQLAQC
jgi:hypothetical protein